jgi:hypothetical protein
MSTSFHTSFLLYFVTRNMSVFCYDLRRLREKMVSQMNIFQHYFTVAYCRTSDEL